MPDRILLIDNNCLNVLQSGRAKERLRANLRATGREFWPTGMNALEAVQSSDPAKRVRLLRTLSDLAGDNLAFPLPEHAVQRVAESIAHGSPMIEWVDHKLTGLFRYPEGSTEDEIQAVREYLMQQEVGFDEVHSKGRETITPELLNSPW
jgi:hypothetical protein